LVEPPARETTTWLRGGVGQGRTLADCSFVIPLD
jgi:hypothetical protein